MNIYHLGDTTVTKLWKKYRVSKTLRYGVNILVLTPKFSQKDRQSIFTIANIGIIWIASWSNWYRDTRIFAIRTSGKFRKFFASFDFLLNFFCFQNSSENMKRRRELHQPQVIPAETYEKCMLLQNSIFSNNFIQFVLLILTYD